MDCRFNGEDFSKSVGFFFLSRRFLTSLEQVREQLAGCTEWSMMLFWATGCMKRPLKASLPIL